MTLLACGFLTLLLGVWIPLGAGPNPPQKFATVTLSVLSSLGQSQAGCHLLEFVLLDDGANADYKSRFDGLVGKNIPFGYSYRVSVKCTDPGAGGSFWIPVLRSDQFVVLSSWPHLGDYFTGDEPRLTVSVSRHSGAQTLGQAWVKVIGVYVDGREVDKLDSQSGATRFYHLEPGRFLVLLLTGERVLCTKQIDVLGPEARLELSLSGQGCKAEGLSSVKVVD